MARVKRILEVVWEFCKYLFLTPAGGSKRHAEQQAYEGQLDEAMWDVALNCNVPV